MSTNKYQDIMNEYRKALNCFERLTDVDVHKTIFTEKPNNILINEALYLMFKEGASLAEKYLKNDKEKIPLLKENISSLEEKIIHKYEKDPEPKEEQYISANNVLKDAQTAFYRGAETRIKYADKKIDRKYFSEIISNNTRYI